MNTTEKKRRITRKEYIATEFGSDIADVERYQPRRDEPFPLFCYEGRICAVFKAGDSQPAAFKALDGERLFRMKRSFLDRQVLVFIETDDKAKAVDVGTALSDRQLA